MFKTVFRPHHINASMDDFKGNDGIGRYVLLPGSDGRAKEIAEHFDALTTKHHERGHNLYIGTIKHDKKKIDVAAISTGMGCASTEIILHELFQLGAKRFLRIGTAGTLQPSQISIGSLINVEAAVRDEDTTRHYVPLEFPAIASLEFITSILLAAEKLRLADELHTGIVHCKSSLYARELAAGPLAPQNQSYLNLLTQVGVLATEMETAILFILAQLYNYQLKQLGEKPEHHVLAGAILSIIATPDQFDDSPTTKSTIQHSIDLGLETVKILASQELIV